MPTVAAAWDRVRLVSSWEALGKVFLRVFFLPRPPSTPRSPAFFCACFASFVATASNRLARWTAAVPTADFEKALLPAGDLNPNRVVKELRKNQQRKKRQGDRSNPNYSSDLPRWLGLAARGAFAELEMTWEGGDRRTPPFPHDQTCGGGGGTLDCREDHPGSGCAAGARARTASAT